MNSDEMFAQACGVVRDATGCGEPTAERLVRSIASYIARFNEEIINQHGPAHEYCVRHGI